MNNLFIFSLPHWTRLKPQCVLNILNYVYKPTYIHTYIHSYIVYSLFYFQMLTMGVHYFILTIYICTSIHTSFYMYGVVFRCKKYSSRFLNLFFFEIFFFLIKSFKFFIYIFTNTYICIYYNLLFFNFLLNWFFLFFWFYFSNRLYRQ